MAKAKEVQPFAEKLITLAKDGWSLDHFRRCSAVLTSKKVAYKLFHEVGPRYKERSGGYTRIYKLARFARVTQPRWPSSLSWVSTSDQGTDQARRRRKLTRRGSLQSRRRESRIDNLAIGSRLVPRSPGYPHRFDSFSKGSNNDRETI